MLHLRTRICSPATDRTKVVGTPNFIKDVGTCVSRMINSASIFVLPVAPTDLFYDKHAPFHDTVNPKTTFDIVDLGRSVVQPRRSRSHLHGATTADQQRPAAASSDQRRPAGARL
jgi:hypothetical protein